MFRQALEVRGCILVFSRLSDIQRIRAWDIFGPDAAAFLQLVDQVGPYGVIAGRDARTDDGNTPIGPDGFFQRGENDVVRRWRITCLTVAHQRVSASQHQHIRSPERWFERYPTSIISVTYM